ncbi:MAG: hypothetical protein M1833_002042 [Piccolia ochrophora]|nr:MAG: hypothetical protein M1833_002042 [Piccolia ochrophora]
MPINQPSNQIKLTNVSLVRMKKGKKRYEIACYKNKVLEYRSGVETDLDNVLQIPAVFLSVSKGQTAPTQDLAKSFGPKTPLNDIILEILNKGELQVGEKERNAQLDRVHHEVVDIVAGKLVDPRTKRVYTPGMIEKALAELSSSHGHESKGGAGGTASGAAGGQAGGTSTPNPTDPPTTADGDKKDAPPRKVPHTPSWTGVVTTRSAKSQALEAMKALIAHQPIPLARARMRLRITCPTGLLKQNVKAAPTQKGGKGKDDGGDDAGDEKDHGKGTVKERILSYVEQVEAQDVVGEEWEVVGFVEPGAFKGLGEFVGGETKGKGRVEVLDMAVVHEDD